jgi:nucleoside-diphosphate-sugar epimerase
MILVTGAGGFVGRHLIQSFESRLPGASIRAFDIKFHSGDPPQSIETICGSIEDPDAVKTVVDGVEVVIHLAAKVVPHSQDLTEMTRTNVEGSRLLYHAAVESGCRHFIYLSSAGVYGPPRTTSPFRETDTPRPVTPYQRTKWQAEVALRAENARHTTLNILRPAGVYGAGSLLEIPTYRKVLRKRWTVELCGGVVVQPTHISELVEAILAILDVPAPHGEVFNFGGQYILRVQELETLVAKTLSVSRRSLIIPPWIAGPLSVPASTILARLGRVNPLLQRMARGETFSAAVDDSVFRQRYPHIPVVELEKGLQEHIGWARSSGLLQ